MGSPISSAMRCLAASRSQLENFTSKSIRPPSPQPAKHFHVPLSRLTDSEGLRSSWKGQRSFISGPDPRSCPLRRVSKYLRACAEFSTTPPSTLELQQTE